MLLIFVSFVVALSVTWVIVRLSHKNKKLLDFDLNSIQKVHAFPVPRIGGLGIFIAAAAD